MPSSCCLDLLRLLLSLRLLLLLHGLLLLRRGLLLLHRLLLLGLRLLLGLHDGLLVVVVVAAADQGQARRADASARGRRQEGSTRDASSPHPGPVVSL